MDRATARATVASAVVLAVGVVASAFWWLPAAIAAYAHVSLPLAWISALALAAIFLQPQFLVAGAFRLLARRSGAPRAAVAILTVLAYVAAEWAVAEDAGRYPRDGAFSLDLAATGGGAGSPRALTILCLVVSECIAAAAIVAATSLYSVGRVRTIEAATRVEQDESAQHDHEDDGQTSIPTGCIDGRSSGRGSRFGYFAPAAFGAIREQ
jgi:hypothetical protein